MERKSYAIFVAGGSGTRMGSEMPKQFLEIGGIPVLQMTIERFTNAIPGLKVVTVLPKAHFQTWKRLCLTHAFNYPQILVEGGLTRFHSVKNALERVPDGAIVAIQDGVRPLASEELIQKMFSSLKNDRASVPMVRIADSLKFSDGSFPEPDRNNIVAVQTPQMFLSEDIKRAYLQAYDPAFTDDMSVAVRAGIPVSFVDGERTNIKLTTPEDLALANAIIYCNR